LLIHSSTDREEIMMPSFTTWPAMQITDHWATWSFGRSPAEDRAAATASTGSGTFLRGLLSLIGAAGVALLVPFFVVGLPLALAWRAILGVTAWRGVSGTP
jgi:hypothetical protein